MPGHGSHGRSAQGETNKPNIHISAARVAAAGAASGRSTEYAMLHGSNIRRPQLAFADPVDNSNTHFLHKLMVKPNALVPLVRRTWCCYVAERGKVFAQPSRCAKTRLCLDLLAESPSSRAAQADNDAPHDAAGDAAEQRLRETHQPLSGRAYLH